MSSAKSPWKRARISEPAKAKLADICGRRARGLPPEELTRLFPEWSGKDRALLRNPRPGYFGWERLLFIAERLGIAVDVMVEEAA